MAGVGDAVAVLRHRIRTIGSSGCDQEAPNWAARGGSLCNCTCRYVRNGVGPGFGGLGGFGGNGGVGIGGVGLMPAVRNGVGFGFGGIGGIGLGGIGPMPAVRNGVGPGFFGGIGGFGGCGGMGFGGRICGATVTVCWSAAAVGVATYPATNNNESIKTLRTILRVMIFTPASRILDISRYGVSGRSRKRNALAMTCL
jgi:hypothetical protein